MNTRLLILSVAIFVIVTPGLDSYASERGINFGVDASAGVEYDSNAGLIELDEKSGEADSATIATAGVDMTVSTGAPVSLRFAYDYSDTAYRRFSEFDLGLHHAHAELAHNNRRFDAAIATDRYDGVLDGDHYLTLTQYSPSVSTILGSRVYVRGSYIASVKSYDDLSARNASGGALRLDTYVLLDGMNRYLSLGWQQATEDAVDAELDFDSVRLGLGYGQKFTLPSMELTLKATMRYEQRDYRNVTESIDVRRKDTRLRSSIVAAIPFTDHIGLEGVVERTDNRSNLDSAAVGKVAYAVKLKMQF